MVRSAAAAAAAAAQSYVDDRYLLDVLHFVLNPKTKTGHINDRCQEDRMDLYMVIQNQSQ